MRRADIISSAVVTLFGLLVLFVIIPDWVPGHEDGAYGLQPADFPFVTMSIATALAAAFCIWCITRTRPEATDGTPFESYHAVFLAGTMAVLVVAYLLFTYLGFLAGGPFVLAVFMFLMGERKILPIVVTATVVPLALWGFFWKLLQFPLP